MAKRAAQWRGVTGETIWGYARQAHHGDDDKTPTADHGTKGGSVD